MSIISVLNPKGGCGKTTISTNLARALHDRGHSVLIVDSDPQGSARDWHAANEDNPIDLVALDRPNNVKTLDSMAANYDYRLHPSRQIAAQSPAGKWMVVASVFSLLWTISPARTSR